jgi:hypothetical protein
MVEQPVVFTSEDKSRRNKEYIVRPERVGLTFRRVYENNKNHADTKIASHNVRMWDDENPHDNKWYLLTYHGVKLVTIVDIGNELRAYTGKDTYVVLGGELVSLQRRLSNHHRDLRSQFRQ